MSNPLKGKFGKVLVAVIVIAAVAYGVGAIYLASQAGAVGAAGAAGAGAAAGGGAAGATAATSGAAVAGGAAGSAGGAAGAAGVGGATAAGTGATTAAGATAAGTTAAVVPTAAAAAPAATGFSSLSPITQYAIVQAGASGLAAATADDPPNPEVERLKFLHGQRSTNIDTSQTAQHSPLLRGRPAIEQQPIAPGQTAGGSAGQNAIAGTQVSAPATRPQAPARTAAQPHRDPITGQLV